MYRSIQFTYSTSLLLFFNISAAFWYHAIVFFFFLMCDNDVEFSNSSCSSSVISCQRGHPLFLHHSDHPSLLFVSKWLNGDNYNSWCRGIKNLLSAKKKTGFIIGKFKEHNEALNPQEHALWQHCNDMVLSWIPNSLEPELADSVLLWNTPHAVWEDLCERFSLGYTSRIF